MNTDGQDVFYKWTIAPGHVLVLPGSALDVVHVGTQFDAVTMWVRMAGGPVTGEERKFSIVGTGLPFPSHWTHVGTAQVGSFVWHVMEMTKALEVEA